MANLMAFGTRNRLAMIPCPLSTLGRAVNRQRTDYDMSNGATMVKTARDVQASVRLHLARHAGQRHACHRDGQGEQRSAVLLLGPRHPGQRLGMRLPAFWSAPGWYMGVDNALAADFSGQFALMNRNDGTLSDGTVATPGGYVTSIACPEIGVKLTYPVVTPPYPVKDQCSGGVLPYLLDSGVLKATHVAATVIVPPSYKFAMRITADVAERHAGRLLHPAHLSGQRPVLLDLGHDGDPAGPVRDHHADHVHQHQQPVEHGRHLLRRLRLGHCGWCAESVRAGGVRPAFGRDAACVVLAGCRRDAAVPRRGWGCRSVSTGSHPLTSASNTASRGQ